MSLEMEILLKRRKIAELQSQQYALAIEEAQAQEELRTLLANQASVSGSGTGLDTPNENVVQTDKNVALSSQNLPDLRNGGHEEARVVSPSPEMRHTIEDVTSYPALQYAADFERRLEASTTESPPVQSIETAAGQEGYLHHIGDRVELDGSIYSGGQYRFKSSPSPALQRSQSHARDNELTSPEAISTQQVSANAREYIPSQSFFLPTQTSPTSYEPKEATRYMGPCHNILTTTTSPVDNTILLRNDIRPDGYFQSPARPSTTLASMPTPTTPYTAPVGTLQFTPNAGHWHSPMQGMVSHTSTENYNPRGIFQPNLWSLAPQNQFQFGPTSGNPYVGQAEASRYSLAMSNQMQTGVSQSPEQHQAVTANTLSSAKVSAQSGLGSCALKRKIAPFTQEGPSVPQDHNEDQREFQNLQHSSGSKPSNSRKRSSSITITNARCVRRRAEESARVITPPLNHEERSEVDRDDSRQETTATQHHQHNVRSQSPTRSRSRSQSSHSSLEMDDTEEESDEHEMPSDQSALSSPRDEQGRRTITSMQQRIFPRVTSQPYTLHMQTRPRSPSAPPVRTRLSLISNQGQQRAAIGRPAYQQQIRHRRTAGTTMLTNSYQPSPFRRLTPSERNELELRYCARLARLLCDNTCVSSPPLPLCDETLWQRLRRRFRVEDGREPPPKYNPDECYTNAADFEVDVKAMLRQYVVLGHCGEQAQNQGQSRNARSARCEFEKTGNARVMCWRMRLESILDEKLRQLRYVLRECEDSCEGDDMEGKLACVDAAFDGVRLGD